MRDAPPLVIESRFQGPPGSTNGGYVCGLLADALPPGDGVSVRLRRPVPLERELRIEPADGGAVALVCARRDGEPGTLAGAGRDGEPGTLAVAATAGAPEASDFPVVDVERARAVPPDPDMLANHPFPGCFGCGPERDGSDAVALHPGRTQGGVWATSWNPGEGLPHLPDGRLTSAVIWAALDCPSSFAAVPAGSPPHVLGTLVGTVADPIRVGDELVVVAWPLGHEGRKRWGATAILDASGDLRAHARATWIALA